MRTGPVIGGLMLLIVGAVLFLWTYQELQKFESLGVLGTAARVISQDVQTDYAMLQLFQIVGLVFGIAGIGGLAFGLAAKG